jgi:hypothetical protein
MALALQLVLVSVIQSIISFMTTATSVIPSNSKREDMYRFINEINWASSRPKFNLKKLN